MDTTVVKGLRVLELLAKSEHPVRLVDLASALGLQRSNAHRLLSTLRELGYVDKDGRSGGYLATLKAWELGAGVIARHPLRRAASPFLEELHRATGETVSLLLLDGLEAIVLDKLTSPRPLRVSSHPGARFPALLNAAGRCMLAHEPELSRRVAETIATFPQARSLDPDVEVGRLNKSAARGYALGASLLTPGVIGLASPILRSSGRAAGALMVSGPETRFKGEVLARAIELLPCVCVRVAESCAPS